MLADRNSSAIVPCRDVAAAKRFYTGTLGLPLAEDHGRGGAVRGPVTRACPGIAAVHCRDVRDAKPM